MSRSTDEVLSLNEGVPKKVYFGIFDVVRGILILMVVLYHYQQAFLGNGFLIQPDGIMANFQRLQISQGGGFIDIFKNIFTSLFAYGFSAVNVFLLLSGFVLTWSGLQDAGKAMERKEKAKIYIFKKMRRILIPFYISILVTFVLMLIRNYFFPAIAWWPPYTWFDYTKFLLVPYLFFDLDLLQMLNGDYWYITIILQFYLIFPVLFWLLQRFGLKKFLLSISLLTFGYRFFATFGYELLLPWIRISFLDTAPMGVLTSAQNSYEGFCFFLPRLAEFGLGMAIAWFQFYKKDFLNDKIQALDKPKQPEIEIEQKPPVVIGSSVLPVDNQQNPTQDNNENEKIRFASNPSGGFININKFASREEKIIIISGPTCPMIEYIKFSKKSSKDFDFKSSFVISNKTK
jgi:peptidoglycan/LPS O-acetylase OafA/YrhL